MNHDTKFADLEPASGEVPQHCSNWAPAWELERINAASLHSMVSVSIVVIVVLFSTPVLGALLIRLLG